MKPLPVLAGRPLHTMYVDNLIVVASESMPVEKTVRQAVERFNSIENCARDEA